jgi:hypothetical protein
LPWPKQSIFGTSLIAGPLLLLLQHMQHNHNQAPILLRLK